MQTSATAVAVNGEVAEPVNARPAPRVTCTPSTSVGRPDDALSTSVGVQLLVQFAVVVVQFAVHGGLQFVVQGGLQFVVHGLQSVVQGLQLVVHGLQFVVHGLQFVVQSGVVGLHGVCAGLPLPMPLLPPLGLPFTSHS